MEYKVLKLSTVNNPLVSIIVPMYNVENYIDETIYSLIRQTLNNIEIILIDDGSYDQTVNIVKKLISEKKNITLVIKENAGPGSARNLGLKLAHGEYICFVDSDDIVPEEAIENMYNAALKMKVKLVTGMSQSFNSKRKWFIKSHVEHSVYDEGLKELYKDPGMLYSVGPCNKLFKRDLLDDIEYPTHIKVTEDHPFMLEAYLKANGFYTLDKIIYLYRQREDENNASLSQTVNFNSASVVHDIMESIKISDQVWGKYEQDNVKIIQMKMNYYSRILRADLWPAILRAIKVNNSVELGEIFKYVEEWIERIDQHLLKETVSIKRMLTFQMINKYTSLPKNIKKQYKKILKCYFHKTNGKNLITIKVGLLYSSYFVQALFDRIGQSYIGFRERFIKKSLFLLKKMLPIKKHKVIVITNRKKSSSDEFYKVYNEMVKINKQTKAYFKFNKNMLNLFKFYFDITTAEKLILDDYYYNTLKIRKETKVIKGYNYNM